MNWGVGWRISTIITGLIMLVVAPQLLEIKSLSVFYALYSTSAAVALVDFGFTNQLMIVGFKKYEKKRKLKIIKIFIIKNLLFLVLAFVYLRSLYEIIEDGKALFLAISTAITFMITYISLCVLAYVEGNISEKLAYKWRTYSEILGSIILIGLLLLGFGVASLLGLFLGRSIISILALWKNISIHRENECVSDYESNFSLKVGIVMLIGYIASSGLPNIILWLHGPFYSVAFSQAYLFFSTLFAICMSYFIYNQKYIKDTLHQLTYQEFISYKKLYEVRLTSGFYILVTLAGIAFCLTFYYRYNVIKFNIIEFICLSIFFGVMINNHIITIIYRMIGLEITFFASIIGNGSVLIILAISYYFESYELFLIGLSIISILINKIWTDYIYSMANKRKYQ